MTSERQASDGGATVLLRASTIRTGGGSDADGDALLVRDGVILEVGAADALAALGGTSARMVDARPWTILPGLVDAHCHLAQLGVLASAADLRPGQVGDLTGLLDAMAATAPDATGWVTGHGYTEYGLRDGRSPTRSELDSAIPRDPAVVFHASLHTCVVNSVALAVLGLDDGSPDPSGGRLGRAADGALDGRLVEAPMFDLFASLISQRLRLEGPALVAAATRRLAAFGITTCVDANTTADEFAALAAGASGGRLAVRVACLLRYEDASRVLATGPEGTDGRLDVIGAKVFADGGMSSRTAAVEPAYVTPAGERGMLLLDARALAARARACAELGIGIGVHAQGERAIEATLDAVATVGRDAPPVRRLEHAGAFAPPLRARARDLGLQVATQPAFLSSLGDGFLEAFGLIHSRYLYPLRSIIDLGIPVSGSSDAPVVTASPWMAMRDAVLRRTSSGAIIAEAERIDVAAALAMYMSGGSPMTSVRPSVGRIAAGMAADLVVVDRDPSSTAAEDLADTRVVATILDGRLQHGALPGW